MATARALMRGLIRPGGLINEKSPPQTQTKPGRKL